MFQQGLSGTSKQLIHLGRGQDQLECYFLQCSIVTVCLQGVAWAEVSNLHCATSKQVVTDTHYTASSRYTRLSGKEGKERERQRLSLLSLPVLLPSDSVF